MVSAPGGENLNGFVVIFVTRRNCPLCAKAEPLVSTWVRRLGGRVRTVSIEGNPSLAQEFGTRTPVVIAPTGDVVAEGNIGRAALIVGLAKARLVQMIRT